MKTKSTKKNKNKEDRCSFNELYNTQLDEFEKSLKKLPDKKAELKKLQARKNQSQKLLDRIKKLKEEIKKIESQEDMTEYLLNIHDVLKQKGENDQKMREKKKESKKQVNILDEMNFNNNIESFRVEESSYEKEKLIDDFLLATTGVSKSLTEKGSGTDRATTDFQCKYCKEEGVIIRCNEKQDRICETCGTCWYYHDVEIAHWSDCVEVTKQYRYSRKTYFIEHLNRIQAKENATIPKELIDKILDELHKRRINRAEEITVSLLRGILSSLKCSEYYDNIHSIIQQISGKKPAKLSTELEDTLVDMFKKTLAPFDKYKNMIEKRNNYLSYPYVIRKLLHIIAIKQNDESIKEYCKLFNLLKSGDKLRDQEKVWEKICKDLGWPFEKSV